MQFDNLNDLAGKLVRSLRSDIHEAIFMHTDKSVYKAGETVWFNAYLLNKVSHKISHESRILFVDLVNENDSVISQLLMDPKSLRLDGSIHLPEVLRDGNYWLRAYTNNILQTDSSDICVHPIYIVNSQNQGHANYLSTVVNPFLNRAPKFEIFPEGGALIAGVNCTVAFHVTDQENNPLEVDGFVKDNRDTVTTKFKTSLAGLGKFSIFPWNTRQYTVYIKTKGGQMFSYPLPAIDNYAACLSIVSENDNSVKVRVSLGDSLYNKPTVTYLLGVSRDSLCFAGVGEKMYETDIPKSNFPEGEATLLLFDEHKKLLSERSMYLESQSVIVSVEADRQEYGPREKAALSISVNTTDHRPVLALFSAGVTDDNVVGYFYDDDIENVMKKPYSADEKDLIMLAQQNKYRSWQLGDSLTLAKHTTADDKFFSTSGIVLNEKNLPVSNVVVTLLSTRGQGIAKTDTTDQHGRFQFNLPSYSDSTQFIVQAADKKGRPINANIVLDTISLPGFNTPLFLKKPLPPEATREIIQERAVPPDFLLPGRGKELQEVIVHGRVKKLLTYDDRKRVSQFSRVITPEMLERASFGTLSNVLFMIPGAHMINGKLIVDPGGDAEPMLVMDGVEVPLGTATIRSGDSNVAITSIEGPSPLINYINSLSPEYIDFIEVLTGPEAAQYGVRGGNGVIVINTRSSVRETSSSKQNVVKRFYPVGYTMSGPFVAPDYDKKEVKKNKAPDDRSTIYWSGPVITDDKGNATLNFYTADPSSNYTVTVKGVTAGGDIFLKRVSIRRR